MVQRPLRAPAWTRLYLASQPDSQPAVHAPCHDPGRGRGSEWFPNGFGSRGNGVWLYFNSLPDKKFKTCSRNIYVQIIISNEITFRDSGQMKCFCLYESESRRVLLPNVEQICDIRKLLRCFV